MPPHPRVPFTLLRGAVSWCLFQYIIKNTIFKMSSNTKTNCYGLSTGRRELYFPSVGCRKPKKIGKHWFTRSAINFLSSAVWLHGPSDRLVSRSCRLLDVLRMCSKRSNNLPSIMWIRWFGIWWRQRLLQLGGKCCSTVWSKLFMFSGCFLHWRWFFDFKVNFHRICW